MPVLPRRHESTKSRSIDKRKKKITSSPHCFCIHDRCATCSISPRPRQQCPFPFLEKGRAREERCRPTPVALSRATLRFRDVFSPVKILDRTFYLTSSLTKRKSAPVIGNILFRFCSIDHGDRSPRVLAKSRERKNENAPVARAIASRRFSRENDWILEEGEARAGLTELYLAQPLRDMTDRCISVLIRSLSSRSSPRPGRLFSPVAFAPTCLPLPRFDFVPQAAAPGSLLGPLVRFDSTFVCREWKVFGLRERGTPRTPRSATTQPPTT